MNDNRFYLEILHTRRRHLEAEIAAAGRWSEKYEGLRQELENLEEEILTVMEGRK